MPAVHTYTVRVVYWTPQGFKAALFTTSGSRPAVAISRAMGMAENIRAVRRSGILGAVITEGPPGFKVPTAADLGIEPGGPA